MNKITRDDVNDFQLLCDLDDNEGGNALDAYQELATQSSFYPGNGSALGLAYVGLKLNGEAGEFAEHVGKAMRDDGFGEKELTPERKTLIINEIGDVLWYLSAACNELGIDLSEAAYANLDKLCSRTERGVLKGSGDER
jgi:NTP pyrophosphatase (non-canonical NTP hydrolase)